MLSARVPVALAAAFLVGRVAVADPFVGVRWFRGGIHTAANPVCNTPKLSYFGGPIVQSPTIVAVNWSSAVNQTQKTNMPQFFADVTQSSYWSWLHEYDTVGRSPGTAQAILSGDSTVADVTIAPLKCPTTSTCTLNDADLPAELTRQIGLGNLPAPTLDCTGNVKTVYMISFPPNVSLRGPGGFLTSCSNGGFCGYHYTSTFGPSQVPLIYAALMDVYTGPCRNGCGTGTALQVATELASHELVEVVTDPDIGLVPSNNFAAPAGWGDNNNGCGEIADICADGSPGDTITVSGRSWTVQPVWSNKQNKCASSGPSLAVCSGTTTTGCRPCSCGDNGGACAGATLACETTPANVLFGACEQCTSSVACGNGGTCQQSSMPGLDDVCVGGTLADGGAPQDLAAPADLVRSPDLAPPIDLAPADATAPPADLRPQVDLFAALDLTAPDLVGRDAASGAADLASDLSSVVVDATMAGDLTAAAPDAAAVGDAGGSDLAVGDASPIGDGGAAGVDATAMPPAGQNAHGCGCQVAARPPSSSALALALALALVLALGRPRRRRG